MRWSNNEVLYLTSQNMDFGYVKLYSILDFFVSGIVT